MIEVDALMASSASKLKKLPAKMPAKLYRQPESSEPAKLGRSLTLEFTGSRIPVLEKISYAEKTGADTTFWKRSHRDHFFTWTNLPKALT